jgi:hypothetical protein
MSTGSDRDNRIARKCPIVELRVLSTGVVDRKCKREGQNAYVLPTWPLVWRDPSQGKQWECEARNDTFFWNPSYHGVHEHRFSVANFASPRLDLPIPSQFIARYARLRCQTSLSICHATRSGKAVLRAMIIVRK